MFFRGDRKIGDADDKFQRGRHVEAAVANGIVDDAGHDEAAEQCRRGVVRMMLEFGDDFEQGGVGKRPAILFVEGIHDAKAYSDAGAESAGGWHVAFDLDLEAVWLDLAATEERVDGFPRHGVGGCRVFLVVDAIDVQVVGFANRNLVVQLQRDAKRVEAWTEVGGRGGHADGDRRFSHGARYCIA
jgi:hypothetical protein